MAQELLIIFNLFVLEIILSIDNAAVLAIMVKDLPPRDKIKALRYGILGAFLFRGASLFLASLLLRVAWLKIIGGLYLIYLALGPFVTQYDTIEETKDTKDSKIYRLFSSMGVYILWATIILVEIMDMSFSIDNIFASVAITSNITFILIGVFIGIIAIRFVAQLLSTLINKYPSLEKCAFIVIGLLGVKLIVYGIARFTNTQTFDLYFSASMLIIFFSPFLTSKSCDTKEKKLLKV